MPKANRHQYLKGAAILTIHSARFTLTRRRSYRRPAQPLTCTSQYSPLLALSL